MRKVLKISSAIIFALIFLMILSSNVYAGSQELNSLHYEVKLNKDGTAKIEETWNITASETNTLFKQFELYSSETGQYEIKDVEVYDVTNKEYYTNTNEQQYHVEKGGFYGLEIKDDVFEIAWNIGADNTTKTKEYKISYTVVDAIENGVDCSQFYWQFISTDNGMPAENITATITLPVDLETETECKIWAHGSIFGTIHKTDKRTIEVKLPEISPNEMFEVRISVPAGIFENTETKYNENLYLSDILENEEKWADIANEERAGYEREKKLVKIAMIVVYIIDVLCMYVLIKSIKTHYQTKKEYQIGTIEYFRDIPYEDATPGECIFMRKEKVSISDASDLIMATILNFQLKGYLELEEENKKTLIKTNFESINEIGLKQEEKILLKILKKVAAKKRNDAITFDDISDYIYANYETEIPRLESIDSIVKSEEISRGNIDTKNHAFVGFGAIAMMIGIMLSMAIIPAIAIYTELVPCLGIFWFIGIMILVVKGFTRKIKNFTLQGSIEREQWKGLEKYMKDYSRIHDREVFDIVLWEKYLVFAAALGIADRLLKELKIVYPDLEDEFNNSRVVRVVNSNNYARMIRNLSNNVDRSYSKMYNTESSSGSGGGGGFSSGGGGRRWRRKHGRKIEKSSL